MLTQRAPNSRVQPDQLKVAAHQFQTAVGSVLFVTELNRKFALDRPPQPPYLQPHLWGPCCRSELLGYALQMTHQRTLFFDQFFRSTRNIFALGLSRILAGRICAEVSGSGLDLQVQEACLP